MGYSENRNEKETDRRAYRRSADLGNGKEVSGGGTTGSRCQAVRGLWGIADAPYRTNQRRRRAFVLGVQAAEN
jgi:hypothetical protein